MTTARVIPGCSLKHIESKRRLFERNLLIVDIRCRNSNLSSEKCISDDSSIVYRCRNGFSFGNNTSN